MEQCFLRSFYLSGLLMKNNEPSLFGDKMTGITWQTSETSFLHHLCLIVLYLFNPLQPWIMATSWPRSSSSNVMISTSSMALPRNPQKLFTFMTSHLWCGQINVIGCCTFYLALASWVLNNINNLQNDVRQADNVLLFLYCYFNCTYHLHQVS